MRKRVVVITSIALALAACGGSGEPQTDAPAAPLTKNAALPATTTPQRPAPTTMAPRDAPTTSRPTTAPSTKAPTTTKAPASTAPTTTLAGGIVFYAAVTPQHWGQYMEVRPQTFEQIIPDTCNLDAYDSYARVAAYVQNGNGGWFIPSKDELQVLLDSKVISFPIDQDLTSGTWVNKPTAAESRGFDVLYGVKREVLAGTAPSSRGSTVRNVEVMSDGPQSSGNPNNRWGWIYIARVFGPTS